MEKTLIPLLLVYALTATQAMGDVTLVGSASTWGDNTSGDLFDVGGSSSSGGFTLGAASDSVSVLTLYGIETDSVVLTPSVTLEPTGLPITLSPLGSAQSLDNGVSGTIIMGYGQGAAQVSITAAFESVPIPEPAAYAGIIGPLGLGLVHSAGCANTNRKNADLTMANARFVC